MPFAVKFLPSFSVDGTWNVPTTLTFVGCIPVPQAKVLCPFALALLSCFGGRHMECAYYFNFCRLYPGTSSESAVSLCSRDLRLRLLCDEDVHESWLEKIVFVVCSLGSPRLRIGGHGSENHATL